MWPWEKKPEPKPAPVTAQPIVINPTPDQDLKFAEYRSDAIAREIEQRKIEGRPLHHNHDQIVAEAKMYIHSLQAASAWTADQVNAFLARLEKACEGNSQ